MSDHKTAKPVQFPVREEAPPKKPHWLEDGQGAPVRKLFDPALEEPALPPGMSPNEKAAPQPQPQPPPSRQPSAASMFPPAAEPEPGQAGSAAAAATQAAAQQAAAQRAAEAQAAQRAADAAAAARNDQREAHEPAQHEQEHEDEHVVQPPHSLIPGARSSPPPANDIGPELLSEQREAFTHAALELALARAATLAVLEGQLLDLSVEIAESLIERELEHAPELHTTLARAALASLGDAERVTLRTSPQAFEAICQTLGGPETTVSGVHVMVHADDTIPGLGCIVDGENVRIDATVAERLRAVRRAFEDERRKTAEATE